MRPRISATLRLPSYAVAVTGTPSRTPLASTVTVRSPTSGVILSESAWSAATGSIHTVCQMPEDGVYQMPLGSRRCLPIGGFSPFAASVGS
ncbi:hypothetical protein SALBM135S_07307 [Streptomyces alboniger]